MPSGSHARLRRVLLILWLLQLVFVISGSLLPEDQLPPLPLENDKLIHFLSYVLLGLLPVLSTARARTGLIVAGLMPVLGVILEAGQSFIPGRSAEAGDAVANLFGVLVGAGVAMIVRRRVISD